jgi:cation transport regulator
MLILRQEVSNIRFERKSDLPRIIRVALPDDAQELYLEAYNRAWAKHDGEEAESGRDQRDAVAHQAGWTAVEQEFVHDQAKGRWYPKQQAEDQGILSKLKSFM